MLVLPLAMLDVSLNIYWYWGLAEKTMFLVKIQTAAISNKCLWRAVHLLAIKNFRTCVILLFRKKSLFERFGSLDKSKVLKLKINFLELTEINFIFLSFFSNIIITWGIYISFYIEWCKKKIFEKQLKISRYDQNINYISMFTWDEN